MPESPKRSQPLSAAELAAVCAELGTFRGFVVRDAVQLAERDDLLLFLCDDESTRALHVVPGGPRARLTTTRRRFRRDAFQTGPRIDRLQELLTGARFEGATVRSGERAATLHFDRDAARHLEVELFGARGLWALTDTDHRIQVLSRLPNAKQRTLRPGAPYEPLPPGDRPATASEPRFAQPLLDAIDRHFTDLDLAEEASGERERITRLLEKLHKKVHSKAEGLRRQRDAMRGADALRQQADMLMAYGSSAPKEAPSLRVPHPERPGEELVIERDTRVPAHVQAGAIYKKARKYDDGLATAEARLAEIEAERDEVESVRLGLEGEASTLEQAHALLARHGMVQAKPTQKDVQKKKKADKLTGGENLRRFESVEGYPILIGRDNRQNDRLSTRIARGNDLWLHVGRGYAGSHVVVRLPKGRTASLETLLDAATLAIHFSKVRGAEIEEVIYTQAKNVRKPKGLPPGRVVPSRTKSIRVRREEDRLERLLGSSGAEPR